MFNRGVNELSVAPRGANMIFVDTYVCIIFGIFRMSGDFSERNENEKRADR